MSRVNSRQTTSHCAADQQASRHQAGGYASGHPTGPTYGHTNGTSPCTANITRNNSATWRTRRRCRDISRHQAIAGSPGPRSKLRPGLMWALAAQKERPGIKPGLDNRFRVGIPASGVPGSGIQVAPGVPATTPAAGSMPAAGSTPALVSPLDRLIGILGEFGVHAADLL